FGNFPQARSEQEPTKGQGGDHDQHNHGPDQPPACDRAAFRGNGHGRYEVLAEKDVQESEGNHHDSCNNPHVSVHSFASPASLSLERPRDYSETGVLNSQTPTSEKLIALGVGSWELDVESVARSRAATRSRNEGSRSGLANRLSTDSETILHRTARAYDAALQIGRNLLIFRALGAE